ncbi:MAG: hypothetical protein L6R28_19865 [Planctomycetes bacterium]|nr:hypothetical protein [Planctomycetota bacterium]
MAWLILSILMSFGFGQAFKWAQRQGCHAPSVVTANYLFMALLLAAYLGARGELSGDGAAWRMGLFIGVFFIAAMLVMTYGLDVAHVGAVLTAFRLAILVPVAAGLWIWGETLSARQVAGLVLGIASLMLMTRGDTSPQRVTGARALLLLAVIFLIQGGGQIGLRWVDKAGLKDQHLQVLFATALVAGSLGAAFVAARRRMPRRRDVFVGMAIGTHNMVNLAAILVALSLYEGAVYFPIAGCAAVILDNLAAHFLWKERLARPALAGAALGAVSVLLVY